jgi:hypothetical protein
VPNRRRKLQDDRTKRHCTLGQCVTSAASGDVACAHESAEGHGISWVRGAPIRPPRLPARSSTFRISTTSSQPVPPSHQRSASLQQVPFRRTCRDADGLDVWISTMPICATVPRWRPRHSVTSTSAVNRAAEDTRRASSRPESSRLAPAAGRLQPVRFGSAPAAMPRTARTTLRASARRRGARRTFHAPYQKADHRRAVKGQRRRQLQKQRPSSIGHAVCLSQKCDEGLSRVLQLQFVCNRARYLHREPKCRRRAVTPRRVGGSGVWPVER